MKGSFWFPTILTNPHKNKGLDPEKLKINVKSSKLWHCLSDRQMSRLKEELRCSHGIHTLISDDHTYLTDLALEEIIDNIKDVAISVARLGKKCLDPMYHNLDNIFDNPFEINLKWSGGEYRLKKMEKRVEKMKKFAEVMSQLYGELEGLSALESLFTNMQSNGASQRRMHESHQNVVWHREEVSRLRKISPWVRSYDYIVRLLLRSLFTIVKRIKVVFGITTGMPRGGCFVCTNSMSTLTRASVYPSEGSFRRSISNPGHTPVICGGYPSIKPKRLDHPVADVFEPIKKPTFSFNSKQKLVNGQEPSLGKAGLALLYANVILFFEKLASSHRFISSNARDELYDMLTTNIKQSLRQKLYLSKRETLFAYDESTALDRRSSVLRILGWLSPLAHNMTKWYSERNFVKHHMDSGGNVLLVQTLYYADQASCETAIVDLIMGLH